MWYVHVEQWQETEPGADAFKCWDGKGKDTGEVTKQHMASGSLENTRVNYIKIFLQQNKNGTNGDGMTKLKLCKALDCSLFSGQFGHFCAWLCWISWASANVTGVGHGRTPGGFHWRHIWPTAHRERFLSGSRSLRTLQIAAAVWNASFVFSHSGHFHSRAACGSIVVFQY